MNIANKNSIDRSFHKKFNAKDPLCYQIVLTFLEHKVQSAGVMHGPAACCKAGTKGLFFRSSHLRFFNWEKLTGSLSSWFE